MPNERSFFSPTPAGSGSKVIRATQAKGYSLIEVLIGVTLLAIGLLALAGLQTTSIKGNFFSNNVTQAVYIAQDELERLINLPLDHEALTAGKHDCEPVNRSGITYKKQYSTEVVENLKIHCTVTWNDGVNHSITLSTSRHE